MDADLQADIAAAKALLLACAIEMYLADGHALAEAERMAVALLDSPVADGFPEFSNI